MRRTHVRTGIDLGRRSVKLVRGHAKMRLESVTHLGVEPLDADETAGAQRRSAEALERLMKRLGLERRALGRVAVALRSEDASLREVQMPALSAGEMAQAFPFEMRRHLSLEEMEAPYTAYQVLGGAAPATAASGPEPTGGDGEKIGVLFAAVPRARRAFALEVMAQVGIEPEVLDLATLAALNALRAARRHAAAEGESLCLLDLGGSRAAMHLSGPLGGLLSRVVGPGLPEADDDRAREDYVASVARAAGETLVFYRGRRRSEVRRVHLAGGGALMPGTAEALAESLQRQVEVLDPLQDLASGARGAPETGSSGALFVTACGLCRWWDETDV